MLNYHKFRAKIIECTRCVQTMILERGIVWRHLASYKSGWQTLSTNDLPRCVPGLKMEGYLLSIHGQLLDCFSDTAIDYLQLRVHFCYSIVLAALQSLLGRRYMNSFCLYFFKNSFFASAPLVFGPVLFCNYSKLGRASSTVTLSSMTNRNCNRTTITTTITIHDDYTPRWWRPQQEEQKQQHQQPPSFQVLHSAPWPWLPTSAGSKVGKVPAFRCDKAPLPGYLWNIPWSSRYSLSWMSVPMLESLNSKDTKEGTPPNCSLKFAFMQIDNWWKLIAVRTHCSGWLMLSPCVSKQEEILGSSPLAVWFPTQVAVVLRGNQHSFRFFWASG